MKLRLMMAAVLSTLAFTDQANADADNVYFGDTHLHTSLSADASLQGNRSATPDVAYRYAKGLPVLHPQYAARVQIDTPLDFMAVADHAEFLGVLPAIFKGDKRVGNTAVAEKFLALEKQGKLWQAFFMLSGQSGSGNIDPGFVSKEVSEEAWMEIIDAAERHNEPGKFTTLIGWEWSAMPIPPGEQRGPNLHRVVFMRDGGQTAKRFTPYSADDSQRPEDLWEWLEQTAAATSASFIAMPHNSNIGFGKMFDIVDSDGEPIDAEYAAQRMRWEPVAEATQFKGDSETHPFLAPEDEFADYELFILKGQKVSPGDYLRSALTRGLEIEARVGSNPYQFGMIGASDSHTGLATVEESNFLGKWASASTPAQMFAKGAMGSRDAAMGAAGLAAVWAKENTREAIFDAFKRKEVYSTTGTRLKVRFFGGHDFRPADTQTKALAETGYLKGVPMGSELSAQGDKAPSFLISALKDPVGANLDRIQIVKGWVGKNGKGREEIYSVALSDGRKADANGTVKPVGNTVDLKTGRYENTIGASELSAVWKDPDYHAEQSSVYYYARVLEIPTPRHSLLDALALNEAHPEELPATIQERAYTSPIWVK